MNQKHLLFMLMFIAGIWSATNLKAQPICNLAIVSVDYGEPILPNLLAGQCQPQNTLEIELMYSDGVSDSIKVNGTNFPATGSPQIIQILDIPRELIVELDGTNCYYFEDVTLSELPAAPIMMEGDTVFCAGDTIPSVILSGYPNSTFHWTNRDGSCIQSLFFAGQYNEEWARPHPGEFVVYQEIDGIVTAPLYINIREGLPVEIIGELYFCEAEYSTLNVLVAGQNITPEYDIVWYTPTGIQSDVVSINADVGYLYIVEVTDETGCTGSASVWVEESPLPEIMILEPDPFCEYSPIELTALAYGSGCLQGCEYLWQNPIGVVYNTQTIEAHLEGTYTVTVTGEYGCSSTESIIIEQNCDETVSVSSPENAYNFALYPNPNHGVFSVEFPNNHERWLTLYNLQGQAIYEIKHIGQLAEINIQHLSFPEGMYIMQIHEKEFTVTKCCLLYTSPSPRDLSTSRMPSSA